MDRDAEQAAFPRIDAIPFESEHKFMATLHKNAGGGEMLLVKGAPEVILDHCDRQQTQRGPVPVDRDHFVKAGDRMASQGERVLALAWLPDPSVTAGSLKPAEVADVIAFILSKSKAPAGTTDLPADMAALKQLKYVAPKP